MDVVERKRMEEKNKVNTTRLDLSRISGSKIFFPIFIWKSKEDRRSSM